LKKERVSWDEYFLGLLRKMAARATCNRGETAVVITVDNEIVVTGYVGSPSGLSHCDDVGHQMVTFIDDEGNESQHCIRTNHAEMNAIAQAAKKGKAVNGGTLYCKMTPCYTCAKMLIQVGIKKVVAQKRYHADRLSMEVFEEAEIEVRIIEDTIEQYENQ
jgi:dCMP deaminase